MLIEIGLDHLQHESLALRRGQVVVDDPLPLLALARSGATVYAPPAFTARLTDQTGLLDADHPAARILTL